MAVVAYKAGEPRNIADTPEEQAVRLECLRRVERAKRDRHKHQSTIQDCYRFALPWRHKFGTSEHVYSGHELFDTTAMTVVEDFAADMLTTFTPMKADWVDFEPVESFDAGDLNQLREPLARFKKVLFDEIRRSNLDAALQESYLDLAIGTMALVIQDRHPSEPIHCMAIPSTELLLDRGPWGEVDGRWRQMQVKREDVEIMWPEAKGKLPLQTKTTTNANGENTIEVTDGVYRDWSDRGNERWKYVVFTDARLLLQEDYRGAGSCPYVVARWSRDPTTAWGVGPTYRELPNIKTLDKLRYSVLKNVDKNVDPVVSFENDGSYNLDNGVEPGMWIPREVGSRAPEVIEPRNKFEIAFVTMEDLVHAIKRAHYQDRPEQTGKTPPTATQWADEAAERARRMGTPATNLVHELQYPIVSRFAYLLQRRGRLPKVELQGREIATVPVSPLLRAQEQEEVVRIDRFLEMMGMRFGPEMLNAWVKQDETMQHIAEKMGVPLQLVRDKAEMQQMVATMAQAAQATGMLGGGQGGPAPAGGAPPA